MKELMIQKDFLSLLFKKDNRVMFFPFADGSGTMIADGYGIFLIQKDNYFLNFGFREPSPMIDDIIQGVTRKNYLRARYVCSVPYGKDGKKTGRVFATEEGSYAVIDNKYYRYFTADDMGMVYVASRKDGIIVYDIDNFEVKAYICPVNIVLEEFEKHE